MKPLWWIDRVLADDGLDADARLLLIWLGRKSRAWRYSVAEAQRCMGWGNQKYHRILADLKTAGWVASDHKRDRLGRIKFTFVTVRDVPSPEPRKSVVRAGPARNPDFKEAGPKPRKSVETSSSDTTEKSPSQKPKVKAARVTHPQFNQRGPFNV